jgi:hypothetical protein
VGPGLGTIFQPGLTVLALPRGVGNEAVRDSTDSCPTSVTSPTFVAISVRGRLESYTLRTVLQNCDIEPVQRPAGSSEHRDAFIARPDWLFLAGGVALTAGVFVF